MKVEATSIDLDRLIKEIETVPLEDIPDGSGAARGEGTREGWITGLHMARLCGPGYDDNLKHYPAIYEAICELAEWQGNALIQVMVNRLDAGRKLDKHRDGLPDNYRYHLPVITHPDVEWWDERFGKRHMTLGVWYGPVPYCGILHSMTNDSDVDRYHLVVDFEKN